MKNMEKLKLHPRSYHNKLYDFKSLVEKVPDLEKFLVLNPKGTTTVDFSNQEVVYLLNKSLLLHFYKIDFWKIPNVNLIPPIPGRADYIHYLADLIGCDKAPKNVLDIGTGASLIYPIIGSAVYNWNFVATDINKESLKNAKEIILGNKRLIENVELRLQENSNHILKNIIKETDFFDAVMCNPPFFKSEKEAQMQTLRKLKGLNKKQENIKIKNNFSGKENELWCTGGELMFLKKYINESLAFKLNVGWFTSLVSNENNLKSLQYILKDKLATFKIIEMKQGNKVSRILAWKF